MEGGRACRTPTRPQPSLFCPPTSLLSLSAIPQHPATAQHSASSLPIPQPRMACTLASSSFLLPTPSLFSASLSHVSPASSIQHVSSMFSHACSQAGGRYYVMFSLPWLGREGNNTEGLPQAQVTIMLSEEKHLTETPRCYAFLHRHGGRSAFPLLTYTCSQHSPTTLCMPLELILCLFYAYLAGQPHSEEHMPKSEALLLFIT